MNSFRHDNTSRFSGSISNTSPASPTRPSGIINFHESPIFQPQSCHVATQYCRVNSGSRSACHNFAGVVRIYVTYTKRDSAIELSFQVFLEFLQQPHPAALIFPNPSFSDFVDRSRIEK